MTAFRRRLVSVPTVLVTWLVATLTLPLLLVVAIVVDAARALMTRAPFMAVRLLSFGWAYLTYEVVGLVALFLALLPGSTVERTWAIQRWWANGLLDAAQRIFGLEFAAEGTDVLSASPYVLLMRHASIVDNLLPARYVTDEAGVRLRYVLKRELLGDPCLDVAGNRLPNHFVDRSGADSATELAAIAALARGLGSQEALVIFPEGTRFTPDKRRRVLERLTDRNPALAEVAAGLTNVLPPRVGGVQAALEMPLDVVVCAHRGLEGFATIGDIWRGSMVDRAVELRFWRVSRDEIGPDVGAWLIDEWSEVDAWVSA